MDWGNESASPLLLVHGGRDHCRNWDWTARALRKGYHAIAPDLRGHGDSQWLVGSSYQTLDYVYDIAHLVRQKNLSPVTIISHSMGANISLHYAGLYPDHVHKLVAIEGLFGTPDTPRIQKSSSTHDRLYEWMEETSKLSSRQVKRYPDLDSALQRMREENPHLSGEKARLLTIHGSTQNEDGTYSWKFDNYVRTMSPVGLNAEDTRSIIKNISCPTLLIKGSESWIGDPEESGWLALFQNARSVSIDKAGHWVHHDQLDVFLDIVRAHLKD